MDRGIENLWHERCRQQRESAAAAAAAEKRADSNGGSALGHSKTKKYMSTQLSSGRICKSCTYATCSGLEQHVVLVRNI